MQIKSYQEAVLYLESFIGKVRFEITPEFLKHHDPLERMRVLLNLLGNPQEKFPSVLVGGTSGKGSTAYLISHILTTAGYKTGLTISPHLQRINERLQINEQPISDDEFIKMVGSIVDTIELMKKMEVGAPSYFEILIAMAFLYFACPPSLRSGAGRRAQQKVDIAVVEVGMGGEFDATNTLYPLIAVLTNVSLDHTNVLGGTVQKIARTKAGIIKKYQISNVKYQININKETPKRLIVVTGVTQPSVIKIVEDRCKEVGAELLRIGRNFAYKVKTESLDGTVFDLTIDNDRGLQLNDLKLSLFGKYQVENASLAVETVLQLRKFGFKISQDHIRKALKTAFFAGRFEIVRFKGSPHPFNDSSNPKLKQSANLARANASEHGSQHPLFKSAFRGGARPRNYTLDAKRYTLILDGAHNPTKMEAFLSTLKKLYPKENPTSPLRLRSGLRGARKIFVVGFKFDKDVKKMLKQILKVADGIIITEFRAKTDVSKNASMEISNLKSQIPASPAGGSNLKRGKKINIVVEKSSKSAMEKAFQIAKTQKDSIIIVTGSLYLVGEVRNML